MRVFESMIEICMSEPLQRFTERTEEHIRKLRAVRKMYPVRWSRIGDPGGKLCATSRELTQESELLDLLWNRACVVSDHPGAEGYIGSCHNCVFSLLYSVYGADIIAFLFDQPWVPELTINPFRPQLFVERLSVLERAAHKLNDGTNLPVLLPETTAYFQPGMGVALPEFSDEKHRLLLDSSLRELRDFGELGLSAQAQHEKLTVFIGIVPSSWGYDDEIMAFATEENKARLADSELDSPPEDE